MVWLVAKKVQKISKRICFPSGNIQVDPVKSCGKNADHQRKDKAEYFSSDDRVRGISRKKCCGNVA
ncbi:unknown [Ruminococcus sp. CAG:17]|nr:unknown [Ruminococcus sp. CAG:17]